MSLLAHHHALIAAASGIKLGLEDFSTYPSVTSPAYPLGPPRWYDGDLSSVVTGVGIVKASHNSSTGLRYSTRANTAGKYVRVLLDWYPGITDEVRRILFEVNGALGPSLSPVMFYYAGESAQVGLSNIGVDTHEAGTYELTARPNPNLQISSTEPTWIELYVPTSPNGYLTARTWGESQPRPTLAGYSAKVSDLFNQYGPFSLSGQFVARSINTDTARVRKIAILSTP